MLASIVLGGTLGRNVIDEVSLRAPVNYKMFRNSSVKLFLRRMVRESDVDMY